jgi:hypothetical protein
MVGGVEVVLYECFLLLVFDDVHARGNIRRVSSPRGSTLTPQRSHKAFLPNIFEVSKCSHWQIFAYIHLSHGHIRYMC